MTYMYPFRRGAGRRTQNYAARPNAVLNGVRINPAGGHTGFDDAVPVGTPVHAAADGVIEAAQTFPNFNNAWLYGPMGGLTIVLNAGSSRPTFGYAHLSKSFVRVGQYVKKGQIIGLSGNSGTATTGAHCHVETLPPSWRVGNGTYGRVNPDGYFDEWPDDINTQSTNQEDDMPSPSAAAVADEILNRRFDRAGGIGGTLSLAEMISWYDANLLAAPVNVWAYTNPGTGETRDAYQVLRDIPKDPQTIVANIPDTLVAEIADLLAERLRQ